MALRCNKCGFAQNPDNAHYCGKCGENLNTYYNWKLYDYKHYTAVADSKLKEYKQYEEKVENSWVLNFWSNLKYWWKSAGEEYAIMLAIAVFCIGIFYLFYKCGSDKEVGLQPIKVEGKYGIGYDKDKLLVEAKYDSIAPNKYFHYPLWILYNKATGKKGLAYVTDSVTRIIEPRYERIERAADGRAVLYLKDKYLDSCYISYNGKILDNGPYRKVAGPGGNLANNVCIAAEVGYYSWNLLSPKGIPVENKLFYDIKFGPDSIIRAINQRRVNRSLYPGTVTLYDYQGNKITNREFTDVDYFSDGVAWTYATDSDRDNSIRTVIDKNGNTLFRKYNAKGRVEFKEGIGWYAPSYTSDYRTIVFTAVDKKGRDLFNVEALEVHPFTMGLAPVKTKRDGWNYRLGFVDKAGRMVIPDKYTTRATNLTFGSDSTMEVSLNGVRGRLHRNGTFTPK